RRGVEGRRALGRLARRAGLVAVLDGGVGPPSGGQPDELRALWRGGEGDGSGRVNRLPGLKVQAKAHEAKVPADAHRAWPELPPHSRVDVRLVGELKPGA